MARVSRRCTQCQLPALSSSSQSPPTCRYAAIREMMALQRRGEAHPPRPLTALRGTPHAGFRGVIPCSFLHEGETCSQATLAFAPEAYMRALPV